MGSVLARAGRNLRRACACVRRSLAAGLAAAGQKQRVKSASNRTYELRQEQHLQVVQKIETALGGPGPSEVARDQAAFLGTCQRGLQCAARLRSGLAHRARFRFPERLANAVPAVASRRELQRLSPAVLTPPLRGPLLDSEARRRTPCMKCSLCVPGLNPSPPTIPR